MVCNEILRFCGILLIAQHRMHLEVQLADVNVHVVFLTETNAYTNA